MFYDQDIPYRKVMAHPNAVDIARDSVTLGLTGWRGQPNLMGRPHRHNEVELNVIEEGAVTYVFGGTPVTLTAGRLAFFWAAVPHRIVALDPATTLCWLTIPLALVLHWRLPEALTSRILYGHPVVEVDRGPAQATLDAILARQWLADVRDTGMERRRIALLEIEARLRRLALSLTVEAADIMAPAGRGRSARAERMAHFIAGHYAEDLTVGDVAHAVGLHPNYAMRLFHQTFGMSVVDYLTHYRVADAQRLLATTDLNVLDVALESGFGSSSRFYPAFRRVCGQAPRAYRTALRFPSSPHPSPPGAREMGVASATTIRATMTNSPR